MATVYIDDTATGAADGTSWTNAYTTITAAVTAKAATGPHQYLVASTHTEGASWSASTTIDFGTSGWSSLLSADVTDDSYLAGAILDNSTTQYLDIHGFCYIKGVDIKNERAITVSDTSDEDHIIIDDGGVYLTRNSEFDYIGIYGGSNDGFNRLEIRNSDISFANAGQSFTLSHMGKVIIDNCTLIGTTISNLVRDICTDGAHLEIENTNLNGCNQLWRAGYDLDTQVENATIKRCKVGSTATFDYSLNGINGNADLKLFGDSADNWGSLEVVSGIVGKILTSTTVKRSGGAEWKASNGFSYELQSTSDIGEFNPARFKIGDYELDLSSGATLTFHLIQQDTVSPTGLTNGEFWIEVIYPDNTDNALGVVASSRAADPNSTTTLTTSTQTWTGTTGNTTKQQVAVTIPTVTGLTAAPVEVRVCIAKDVTTGSDEVFICPSPEVT